MTEKVENLSIPLHIVEDHNDALNFILRGIGSKYLKFEDMLLIHFDSHPDLLLNTDLKSDDIFEKEVLLEKVSIETWILPLTFAKHVNTIVWVKPEWSNQIDDGVYNFYIGKTNETEIKVSSPLLYFISALNYCSEKELLESKKVTLHVITLSSNQESMDNCKEKLTALIKENDDHYLLDIDLDFFTTLNPFIEMFQEAKMYERLKLIYKFDEEDMVKYTPPDAQKKRAKQLNDLEHIFRSIEEVENPEEKLIKLDELLSTFDKNITNHLKELISDLFEIYKDDVDWDMVHNAGTTIDDSKRELPHHPSSEKEILLHIDYFEKLLKSLPSPKLITMARSSMDDYCPPSAVEFVQENVVTSVTKVFKTDLQKHYDEEPQEMEEKAEVTLPTSVESSDPTEVLIS